MSAISSLCIVGYAILAQTIVDVMGAGPERQFLAICGVVPISLYCAWLEGQGR